MHFGLYLVRKGVIDADQFVWALEAQLETLVPIGQLAVEEGRLTMAEVFRVLRAQTDVPLERFGEAAIRHGLLSKSDLAMLLMSQSDRKRPLAEILVDQGALDDATVEAELAAFRRHCERSKGRAHDKLTAALSAYAAAAPAPIL